MPLLFAYGIRQVFLFFFSLKLKLLNTFLFKVIDLHHDSANKMTCALSEDSDQPGHLPSLISVFAVCWMGS